MACHHLWDTEQDIDDFSSGRSYSIMKSRYGRCLVASHLWLLGCNHQLTFIHIYRELWCFCLQSRTRLKIWFESKMKKYSIFGRKDLKIPVRSQKREISKHWPLAEFVVLRFWSAEVVVNYFNQKRYDLPLIFISRFKICGALVVGKILCTWYPLMRLIWCR